MGGILSNHKGTSSSKVCEISHSESNKRQRTSSSYWEDSPRLFPTLPDEISIQILARIPRISHLDVKQVSRSWKAAIMSPELYKLRKSFGISEEWLYILTKNDGGKLMWYSLDPISKKWLRLPPMPNVIIDEASRRSWMRNMVGPSIRIADAIMGWLGRKDALDQIPFCGCAIGAVDGSLYVLGGFCKASSMTCVWKYDPIVNSWCEVNSMKIGRAYCKTGVLNNKLYVVGGVTRGRGGLIPLQSAEVFDPVTEVWTEIPNMPFSKAQMLPTAFLADLLKPIATGMTCYKGKLYVPQSLYCWPFFVDVGGEVFDPETNLWVEMPMGMGEGWPARQAGTKLSVIVDGDLYAMDPSSALDSARIKVYDHENDAWKVIEGDVPIRDLTDSESPYLLAGFLGKLHVVTKDASNNIAVMQADRPRFVSEGGSEELVGPSETENMWKIVSTRSAESSELVSCQILDM